MEQLFSGKLIILLRLTDQYVTRNQYLFFLLNYIYFDVDKTHTHTHTK